MSTEEPRDDDRDVAMLRVLRNDGSTDPATDPTLSPDALLRGYREMRRLRLLDEHMLALQRQGRIGFYAAAHGQEAVPIAAALAMAADDWVFPGMHKEGIMLARGFPLRMLVAQVLGNAGDVLKGRQMPSHPSGRAVHQVSWSSCIGSQLPQAVGAAWAMRLRGAAAVSIAFCGDGATSHPDFHAAMNFAGVWQVPCVIVCHNHEGRPTASRTIAVKARAYGFPGVRVDGNDFLAVYAVAHEAIDRARSGGGPTFIEAVTADLEARARQDPMDLVREYLVKIGHWTEAEDARLAGELSAEIRAATTEAEALPPVDAASLVTDVYAETPWHLREQWQIWQGQVGRADR
jgi:pyruvate dehydrogenase E1 component alpha subunit